MKKKKLYEMESFADPAKERERRNALNAKRNRDRKKALIGNAYQKIIKLKSLNKKLLRITTNDKRSFSKPNAKSNYLNLDSSHHQ